MTVVPTVPVNSMPSGPDTAPNVTFVLETEPEIVPVDKHGLPLMLTFPLTSLPVWVKVA